MKLSRLETKHLDKAKDNLKNKKHYTEQDLLNEFEKVKEEFDSNFNDSDTERAKLNHSYDDNLPVGLSDCMAHGMMYGCTSTCKALWNGECEVIEDVLINIENLSKEDKQELEEIYRNGVKK